MTYESHYVLSELRDLQARTEAEARLHPEMRHMLVLPPGESIRIPIGMGAGPRDCVRAPRKRSTRKFGDTKLTGPLPPHTCWPEGFDPLRAFVAEQAFEPFRPLSQIPYRIHLLFGGNSAALRALRSLANEISRIRPEMTRAMFRDHSPFPHGVFYLSPDSLQDEAIARLDSWLCTVHWWTWLWKDAPSGTTPHVVLTDKVYSTSWRNDAVTSKLAFSMIDADILAASSAMLGLLLRFFDQPPALFWNAEYPDIPKADEMNPADVAGLGERFIRYVGNYLTWHNAVNLTAATAHPTAAGSPAEVEYVNQIEEASGRKHEAAAQIRRYGPALAAGLERYGFDSSGVLSIVHSADGGGGPESVFPIWKQAKVALQRDVIRLRQDQGTTGFTPTLDDLQILRELERSPTTLTLVAIEAATSISRKTVGERVKVFRGYGLVQEPYKRKGITLSDAGHVFLKHIHSKGTSNAPP